MFFTYDELKKLNKDRLIMHILILEAILFYLIKLNRKEIK